MTKVKPLLGGHVSAAGGLKNAVANAQNIGAQTFQIHATSPRQWKVKLPDEQVVQDFLDAVKESGITSYYIHAPYLINLASPNPELVDKSFENLKGNFQIGQMIKAKGVVYHLGSSTGTDKGEAIKRQIKEVKKLLKEVKDEGCKLLLENAAGGGDKIGATVDELEDLIKGIGSDRVGVCFDTAHAFEAGILEYTPKAIKEYWDRFDKEIGIEKLACIHLNDSKTEFDSQHDRHDNLGEGHIGVNGLKLFASEKRLHKADWVLETPGFDKTGPDKKNMDLLASLF